MTDKFTIGVDLGATKIEAGLVSLDGRVYKKIKVLTEANKGRKHVIERIVDSIHKVWEEEILGIGVGVPGLLNASAGIVYSLTNMSGWSNFNLRSSLEQSLKLPVFIENDANCFALAEYHFHNVKNLVGLTLGTGIGGGIIINGRIYRGARGIAGELGHMAIVENGIKCRCGNRGCLEMYASGTAIERHYKKITGMRKRASRIAKEDSKTARKVIKEAAHYLGVGLANIANMLNPDVIVIGGGVSRIKEIYAIATDEMRRRAFKEAVAKLKVVPSKLKDEAGLIGAAMLVRY